MLDREQCSEFLCEIVHRCSMGSNDDIRKISLMIQIFKSISVNLGKDELHPRKVRHRHEGHQGGRDDHTGVSSATWPAGAFSNFLSGMPSAH